MPEVLRVCGNNFILLIDVCLTLWSSTVSHVSPQHGNTTILMYNLCICLLTFFFTRANFKIFSTPEDVNLKQSFLKERTLFYACGFARMVSR